MATARPRLEGPNPTPTTSKPGLDVFTVGSGGGGALLGGLDETFGPHVGPVCLDVFQAGVPAVLPVDDLPSGRDGHEMRPQRILAFVVDQDVEHALVIIERIRHPAPPPSWRSPQFCVSRYLTYRYQLP